MARACLRFCVSDLGKYRHLKYITKLKPPLKEINTMIFSFLLISFFPTSEKEREAQRG